MKIARIQFTILSLVLFGASICGANTLTVGPTGQYPTPCPAIKAAAPGDTIQIDYNNGIPYQEPADSTHGNRSDCVFFTNNLTIVGVNGRPVLDAANETIQKSILDVYGHDVIIDNLELRHAATVPGTGDNGAGVRIESGSTSAPGGGNITIRHSYIHDNQDGVLTNNVGPGSGGGTYPDGQYFSANPFITFEYDEFGFNGVGGDGHTHNMYIGFDTNGTLVFTLQYSWTHDAYLGHTVKTRAPINNILYNLITDQVGATSYMIDFPLGGSTYIVGNSIYKTAVTNANANKSWMVWRDVGDAGTTDPDYNTPHEDLHFVNNTVVLDPTSNSPAFVIVSCQASDASTCAAPVAPGLPLSVNAVVQNNIFVGPPTEVTNQTTAVASNNLVEANTPGNLAGLFVDWAHFNYHLVSGAPAIGAGLYPPTDNTGAADPNALATHEYVHPISQVARPTPTGSHMDEGAYSYPRVDTPPNPGLTYTTSVTTPGTGTITLTGLPTPPAGQYNNASFVINGPGIAPISPVSSSTGTITATFSTAPVTGTTVVPIDIYVDGAHLTASVTVIPGPVALQSITLDQTYYPRTTVHLTNPSTSPVVINLSSTDQSILYVPATVTIPAGQITAETGSETGSLWGQTPPSKIATITATYGAATQSLPVTVYAPYVNHFYCNIYPCTIVGGQPINNFIVGIAGDFPPSGGPVTFTSDTPSVVPSQTFQGPAGSFYTGFIVNTNTVTTTTTVTLTINVNGSTKLPNQVITVTPPGVPSSVVVVSGSGQSAQVGINFASPLVVQVNDGSNHPLPSVTVTFAGSGVSFPGGTTVLTNANGQAMVTAQPTTTGSLSVTASVSGVSTPATFSETGTANTTPASITVVSGSGQTSRDGTNFASPLVVVVKNTLGATVAGATVTFAGTGVSFPHGATGVTNSSGQASVTAQPTAVGSLTVNATVSGVSTPATFSETGTVNTPTSIAVSSGSGQTSPLYLNFPASLVVVVKNATGGPVAGVTVNFVGSGVTISGTGVVVTNSSGHAAVNAQPNTTGSVSVTASVAGVSTPAIFSETGTPNNPATIAVVSGSGQSAPVGTYFTNYLIAVVKDAAGSVVPQASVTFAGANVGFSGSTTVVTNSQGQARIKAKPTAGGPLTVTASVSGVGTPASFSETGVTGGLLSSITLDNTYGTGTTVNLTGPAPAGGAVISLTSSDSTVLYAPATVTVPAGASSAETGTLLGSLWGQSPVTKQATITATYAGTSKTLINAYYTVFIHAFYCNSSPCTVTGGQPLGTLIELAGGAVPYGGAPITFTSDNPAAIPNQSVNEPAGASYLGNVNVNTNTVSSSTTVNITMDINGATASFPVTVTP